MPTLKLRETRNTRVLRTSSSEYPKKKVSLLSGEEISLTLSDTSLPKPLTSLSRIPTRRSSAPSTPRLISGNSSWEI